MTPDDFDTLREGWDFEAKLAAGRDGQGALPESLWETYSAMANTEGGVIVLGAKELADRSIHLHGILDIDKVERDLWNILQNPQKVSTNLLRRNDVQRVDLDGRSLLVIQVPKAPRSQRPGPPQRLLGKANLPARSRRRSCRRPRGRAAHAGRCAAGPRRPGPRRLQ